MQNWGHCSIVLKSHQYHPLPFGLRDGSWSLVQTVAFQQTHIRKALAAVPLLLPAFLVALDNSAEILLCLGKVGGIWTLISPSHSAAFSVLREQCGLVILYKRLLAWQLAPEQDMLWAPGQDWLTAQTLNVWQTCKCPGGFIGGN